MNQPASPWMWASEFLRHGGSPYHVAESRVRKKVQHVARTSGSAFSFTVSPAVVCLHVQYNQAFLFAGLCQLVLILRDSNQLSR